MLVHLSVRDFVIVDRIELEFNPGFTVLTGETGAGKSVLIDALALVLGERGDAGVVRQGCERAEIIAEFDIAALPQLQDWLEHNDLQGDSGVCLLRRVIDSGGRSRGFINGHSATLQQLREAGEWLVDIHGQHAHQSLLKLDSQRTLLDGYAGLQAQAAEVTAAYRQWQTLRSRRLALEKDAAHYAAEREQLGWQVRELENLAFGQEEWQTLLAEHGRLSHAASLVEGAQYGLELLAEGDLAIISQVNSLSARLNSLVEYDARLREILDILVPAEIQLQEANYALRHYQQRLDLDPGRLREVEQRLDAVHSAARKFRTTPEQLPELLAGWQVRLQELGGGEQEGDLAQQEEVASAAYLKLAKKLSGGRQKAAQALGQKVSAAMQDLAMIGGRFEIALAVLQEGGAHGLEQVEFLVAAHQGMEPKSLAKVASGGELSRISLAIQVVTSKVAAVPTLIFDEVDVGIGGGVAEIVGNMLKELGRERQALCITHLPQVAALGSQHWRVSKEARDGSVLSRIDVLDQPGRIEEVARMLGGVDITETTRKHAAEMLGLPD
jgi:DNA repair protein RecN (Recombination protein N)